MPGQPLLLVLWCLSLTASPVVQFLSRSPDSPVCSPPDDMCRFCQNFQYVVGPLPSLILLRTADLKQNKNQRNLRSTFITLDGLIIWGFDIHRDGFVYSFLRLFGEGHFA